MDSPKEPGARRILFGLAVLAGILALVILGLRPPSPKPFTAPPGEFSAVRAQDALHRILGADEAHPIGSPANDAVRSRILAELARLGYQTQVQAAFACAGYGGCANVRNVLSRLDGSDARGGAVLLAAHYDSVPAAPGDSDDGTGVAALLEIARALKSLPRLRHAVVFLIDDGEEAGLLGARAFVDSHPWAREVRAAVNLDARGTSGPSLMFETGSADEWAVDLYAKHAARPITNSLLYTAYRRLPNGTDFSVFKEAGYQGLNFAFIDDEVHYHTPLDNSANVTLSSLQHQGDNALASVLALADSGLGGLSSQPQRRAVYFDLFGKVVVRWPARRTIVFVLVAMFLLAGQFLWMIREKRLRPLELRWGLMAWPLTMLAVVVLAVLLRWLLWIGGATPVNWTAHPLPALIAFWSLAAAIVMTSAVILTPRAGFWGLWCGTWTWWILLSLLTALFASGLSYVFLVPVAVAALLGLPATLPRRETREASRWATTLPMFAAAILIFPPVLLLYPGFGARAFVTISILVGLVLTPIAPLFAEAGATKARTLRSIAIVAAGAGACLSNIVPVYSAKAPERLNLKYWQDADSGNSAWIVVPASGRLPEPIRVAMNLRRVERGAFPWENQPSFVTSAPSLALAAPTFTVLRSSQSGGLRIFSALLRSERGAPEATVFFPANSGLDSVRVEGQPLLPESAAARQAYNNGWFVYACPAIPASGIQIEFSLPLGKPVGVLVADQSYALPSQGAFLVNARPLTATRSQDGDVTIVTRHVQLNP